MKKLHLLKALVDLFFFFSVIVTVAFLIFVPMFLFSSEPLDIPVKIGGEKILIMNLNEKLILLAYTIAFGFFVYGIFLFRKVLNHFSKREIFEDSVISLLDKIGKFFLLSSLITAIVHFFSKIYLEGQVELGISSGFDSFLFSASLGLFFMVLSEVFAIGKNIKEENELTI